MMRACWASSLPGNVGDMLTPWMLREAGQSFRRAGEHVSPKVLMAGSIVVWSRPGDTIWGTGNSHDSLVGKVQGPLNVLAVRGPETRKRLMAVGIDCPDTYGDPGLLVRRFYQPNQTKRHTLGIVPHYNDLTAEEVLRRRDAAVISPLRSEDQVPAFLDELAQCERIVSSSLHGLILAHALGIPARWVTFSDRVFGRGLKFRDYLQSVGIEPYEPTWPRERDWTAVDLQIDLEALWACRPWG